VILHTYQSRSIPSKSCLRTTRTTTTSRGRNWEWDSERRGDWNMADAAAELDEGGVVRTLKDLFAGAAGGIAQVLLGEFQVLFSTSITYFYHVPSEVGRMLVEKGYIQATRPLAIPWHFSPFCLRPFNLIPLPNVREQSLTHHRSALRHSKSSSPNHYPILQRPRSGQNHLRQRGRSSFL